MLPPASSAYEYVDKRVALAVVTAMLPHIPGLIVRRYFGRQDSGLTC